MPGLVVLNSLINAPDAKAITKHCIPPASSGRFMVIGMMASPLGLLF
ncbi:hypothetical protein Z949_3674 [Sulfitobacter guttiformis KCTC 32187]|nr:hypothetical protein Z949_3674 [Sulfitobacter guttiformis KCTC 32187]